MGETPGYQDCRRSGVAFTSERQPMDGVIPCIPPIAGGLTSRERSGQWTPLPTVGGGIKGMRDNCQPR